MAFILIALKRLRPRARIDARITQARIAACPGASSAGPSDGLPPLPRCPGWLLAALPDTAPSIDADLDALLADPAWTGLLAAFPTLRRRLAPILRSLGLAPAPPPSDGPPPSASCPDPLAPPAPPTKPPPTGPDLRSTTASSDWTLSQAHFVP